MCFRSLSKLVKRESKGIMVMFYVPWCRFCKQLKPEYSAAATLLKGTAIMAAIDVNRPENAMARMKFNITGFPMLLYFENGAYKYTYEGESKMDSLVKFMKNPTPIQPKLQEEDWSETETDVMHLTSDTFDTFMQGESSTLVMFYAPWCGHCKKMKPEYEKAAQTIRSSELSGSLAAVDATKEVSLAKRFNVQSYPTVKYFRNGAFLWDVPLLRDAEKILEFIKDPKEPPPPPPPEPDWLDQPSEVIHLNGENFKTILKRKRHALVMFYAPWCGHCKLAKPEFTKAAEESKENSRFAFAAVDCTKHTTLCKAAGVAGYPTFKYYHYYSKSNFSDYTGDRKAEDFLSFMAKVEGKKPASPPEVPASTVTPESSTASKTTTSKKESSPQTTGNITPISHSDSASAPTSTVGTPSTTTDTLTGKAPKSPDKVVPTEDKLKTPVSPSPAKNQPVAKSTTPEGAKKSESSLPSGSTSGGSMPSRGHTKETPVAVPKKKKSIWEGVQGAEKIVFLDDSNYKEVLSKSNAMLVMFYGSWCKTCKQLTAEFGRVALTILPSDGTVAACNATENLRIVDKFKVSKLPSLKYFRQGRFVTDYKGKPTAEDILKFMKSPPTSQKQEL